MTNKLKRFQWWQEKNSVAMRESDDNIDHKNVLIIWLNFADEVKHFS